MIYSTRTHDAPLELANLALGLEKSSKPSDPIAFCLLKAEMLTAGWRHILHIQNRFYVEIHQLHIPSHPFTNFTNACGEEIDEPYTLKRDVTR